MYLHRLNHSFNKRNLVLRQISTFCNLLTFRKQLHLQKELYSEKTWYSPPCQNDFEIIVLAIFIQPTYLNKSACTPLDIFFALCYNSLMLFINNTAKYSFTLLRKKLQIRCNLLPACVVLPPPAYYVSSTLTISDLFNDIVFLIKKRRNEVFVCKGFISSFLRLKANNSKKVSIPKEIV